MYKLIQDSAVQCNTHLRFSSGQRNLMKSYQTKANIGEITKIVLQKKLDYLEQSDKTRKIAKF